MAATVRGRRRINRYALRALRAGADLTQEDLAHQAGINHTSISHLERGTRLSCSDEVAERLASTLGVPVMALYLAE